MGVSVTAPSTNEVNNILAKILDIIYQEVTRSLAYLGEQTITYIRDRSGVDSWFDQTGNLRSSIGYAIFQEGKKVIGSTFESVLNGSAGSSAGQAYINSLASKYADAFALVVVAGMDYADYVEAMERKDVLAGGALQARQKIDKYLEIAKSRAIAKINAL